MLAGILHSVGTGEPVRASMAQPPLGRRLSLDVGRATPMRDEDGRIVQWYGVNVDIDDR